MKAWIVRGPRPIDDRPLEFTDVADPQPATGEVRVAVTACGVCRTDLHVAEGDLRPQREFIVPGHEIVGTVDQIGPGVDRFHVGDRVGVAWLHETCGTCPPCRRGTENLCRHPRFTGWTENGGYAQFTVVPQAFAYRLPESLSDEQAAPLLCAGIIGYRALLRSDFRPGDRLGIWGFGGSAHLTSQVALAMGAELYVVSRGANSRQLATELGAAWVGSPQDAVPVALDAAISFAPAGELVPEALSCLRPGGVLALAGIHMTDIPALNYQRHLFDERELRSVTANTRADGEAFLSIAERIGIQSTVHSYPFERADDALADLAHGRFSGAAVLLMDADGAA